MDINLQIIVKLSSCLQLATSLGKISVNAALAPATGQAQPTRALTHIACPSLKENSMWVTSLAKTVVRCARCAWLQWIETSAIAKGHGDRYIGSLFRVDEPVPYDSRTYKSCIGGYSGWAVSVMATADDLVVEGWSNTASQRNRPPT